MTSARRVTFSRHRCSMFPMRARVSSCEDVLPTSGCIEDLAGDEGYFNNLITALTSVSEKSKKDDVIQYAERTKVPNPLSKKGTKIS